MPLFSFKEPKYKEVAKGVSMRSAYLEETMLISFELEPRATVPAHKHPHEHITLILEGEMEFTLGDEIDILRSGDGATLPSNVEHKAVILSHPVKAVDAWYPVRDDYKLE